MPMHRPPKFANRLRLRQRGFTLVEVLVAILVLSFGMLGVVGLQMSAMQANKEARYQSSAVRYARELAEMMRANRTVMANPSGLYYFDSSTTPPAAYGVPSPTSCPASCAQPLVTSPAPGHIDHSDIAKYDLSDWWVRAKNELPSLRVVVCPDAQPYAVGSGKATWTCTAPSATAAGQGIYIKMGWTQQSTNRAANGVTDAVVVTATGTGIPLVVIPVIN